MRSGKLGAALKHSAPVPSFRRVLVCFAAVGGVVAFVAGCSSPMDSRAAPAPQRDAWGDCLTLGADLPADSAWMLVDVPRDAPGVAAPGYAEHRPWFRNSDPIELDGREYGKFGRIFRFQPAGMRARGLDLRRVGEYQGVPLYRIFPDPYSGGVLFIPVRAGCLFYPYQWITDRNMRAHG